METKYKFKMAKEMRGELGDAAIRGTHYTSVATRSGVPRNPHKCMPEGRGRSSAIPASEGGSRIPTVRKLAGPAILASSGLILSPYPQWILLNNQG